MPTEPIEIVAALFAWILVAGFTLAFLRGRADDKHRAALSRWKRSAADAMPGVRDIRVRVLGEPASWTLAGESERIATHEVWRNEAPSLEGVRAGTLVDDDGRAVVLDSALSIPPFVPMRQREGPRRRGDDCGGLDYPSEIETRLVELPAGATFWIRGIVTDDGTRVRIRATAYTLSLATGPGDPIPEERPPVPRPPPLPVLMAFSAVVQLPAMLLFFFASPSLRPAGAGLVIVVWLAVGLGRDAILDAIYLDGR